ncbi:MAG: dTMP kinase [Bacilli bacterium]
MNKRKLIVVEGASDGIGKTTQYELLKDELISKGLNVTSHHFPSYNTYQGKGVEEYLKGGFGDVSKLSPYFVNSLYASDRAITWYKLLKERYDKGDVILLDRYTTSSLIYQSALIEDIEEKNEFIDYVTDFEYNKLGIKSPDKVIFLNAPFDLITKLRNKRKNEDGEAIEGDIHENNLEFMKKVYESANYVAKYLNWDIIDCSDGNKMKSPKEIHEEIMKLML